MLQNVVLVFKKKKDLHDIGERDEREEEEIKRGMREKTTSQIHREEMDKKLEEIRRKVMKESKKEEEE